MGSVLSASDAARITSDVTIRRVHRSIRLSSVNGYFEHTFLCQSEIFPHVKQHFEGLGYNLSHDPESNEATISWFPK